MKKLKDEENASGLIEELLEGHFNAHLSNDLNFLKDQLSNIDIKIKTLEVTRDGITQRIKVVEDMSTKNKAIMEKEAKTRERAKKLTSYLSRLVRSNDISFEDYRSIKSLESWESYVEALLNKEISIEELVRTSRG
jgi:septal ring factor EnvC (AmiA/AmiB activator)